MMGVELNLENNGCIFVHLLQRLLARSLVVLMSSSSRRDLKHRIPHEQAKLLSIEFEISELLCM